MRRRGAWLRAASWLVPRGRRADWLAEWRGELHFVAAQRPGAAAALCRGALRDAVELRREDLDVRLAALVFLAGVVAAMPVPAFPFPVPLLVLAHSAVIAAIVVPAVAPLAWDGEYPAARRLRRRIFFAVKTALIVWVVYRVTIALGSLAPHAMLAGLVAGVCWSLDDQRHRCPVCLRRLAFPTPTGTSATLLLEGHATEYACRAGHGFLHLPSLLRSSYDRERWFGLGSTTLEGQGESANT